MAGTARQFARKVLLTASTVHAAGTLVAGWAFMSAKAPLVPAGAALVTATLLASAVLWAQDLGPRRVWLGAVLVLLGPLSPLAVLRRTRRWKPVLLLRPGPARRSQPR